MLPSEADTKFINYCSSGCSCASVALIPSAVSVASIPSTAAVSPSGVNGTIKEVDEVVVYEILCEQIKKRLMSLPEAIQDPKYTGYFLWLLD
jgi:hypothetical protein